MGIRITNTTDGYELAMLSELLITQRLLRNVNDTPKYVVSFAVRRYKVVDNDGSIEYADDALLEFVEDFQPLATSEAIAGDMTLASALSGDQAAVAKLIADNTSYTTEVY